MHRSLRRAVPFLVLFLASRAEAQFSTPIRYNEGPGWPISDSLVLHPGLAAEMRYDSNVFYATTENPNAQIIGAPYLRLIGHLDLSTLSPQRLTAGEEERVSPKLTFRLKSALAYREYFHENTSVTAKRSVEIDAGLNFVLFPQGFFSFELHDDFTRTLPQWSGPNTPRDTNRGGISLKLRPGGGRLQFALGYNINLDIFEDKNFSFANKYFHEINLHAKWKILPKNAIFLQAVEQFYSYYDPTGGAGLTDATTGQKYINQDSMPLRIYLGFSGLFTPRLGALVKIGYGNSFYDEGDSYNHMLGQAELTFHIGPTAKFKTGFEHTFQDSFYSNYFTEEILYLRYDHLLFSRLLAHVMGKYRYRQYYGFPSGSTVQELVNHILGFNVGIDYKIKEWLFVGIGYDLELRDQTTAGLPYINNQTFTNDFVKHQVFGKVEVSY